MLAAPLLAKATSATHEYAHVQVSAVRPAVYNRKWKPTQVSALTGKLSKPQQCSYLLDSEVVRVMHRIAAENGLSRSALMDRIILKAVQHYMSEGKI